MRWEDRLLTLFEDLEQQAEGLVRAERDAVVAERSRAEYAQVDLLARLHAGVGGLVVLGVAGVGALEGTLRRVGADWCLVDAGAQEWLVRLAALSTVRGLPSRAVPPGARSVAARLGIGSALRRLAEGGSEVVVHRADGVVLRGGLRRVGADFVELAGPAPGVGTAQAQVELVAIGHVSAVRRG